MQVKLFTIKGCSNCQLVKDHLDREGIVYKLIDCDENMDDAITAMKAAGSDILPITCYDGSNYIVGYNKDNIDKLIKLCKS
jgi:arsenate reductase-like glutaredoxin family protein